MVRGERVLLERSEELDRLRAAVDSAVQGRGSVLFIEGTAGVGKTSLLSAGAELASDAGVEVMSARAGELERDLSWNLVRQLFGAVIGCSHRERRRLLSGAAALAAPALGLVDRSDAGALHGLYWLTGDLARQAPRLLAVDDAPWGDLASLRYLAYLAERIEDLPIVLALTARTGVEQEAALATIAASARGEPIRLGALSPTASAVLTRSVLGAAAQEEFCLACHAASSGNPFVLRELLRQLERDGVEPLADHAPSVAAVTPRTVTRSVLVRIAQLPAAAAELANAVALLGGGASLSEATVLAGIDPAEAPASADALARVDILRRGEPLEFVHPLVREVLYAEFGVLECGHRHRQAAQVLAGAGASTERVAAQLVQATPAGEAWVVERLRAVAGEAIATGAPAAAAHLLERALREPPADSDRASVLVELAQAEAAAGSPTAAGRLREALGLITEPELRAGILLHLGRALYVAGQPTQAAAAIDRGLGELAALPNAPAGSRAELQAALLTISRIEPSVRPRALELIHDLEQRPLGTGSYGERALLSQVAEHRLFAAQPREGALELARLALGDGELLRQETSDGMAWVSVAGVLGWSDDFDGFEALGELALADARRRGSVIGFAISSYLFSFGSYHRGRLADAIADAQQAIAAERDGWRQFVPAVRAQLAWALIDIGDLDGAAAALEGVDGLSAAHALVFEARARIQLARNQPQAALESALRAGELLVKGTLILNPSVASWRSRAALAAAALEDLEQAEALLDEELRLARRFGAPRAIGVALAARGVVRRAKGLESLEEAVETLANSSATLEHARALVLHGSELRRQHKINAARERLRAGLDLAATCGAAVLEDRAQRELLAAGARPRRRRTTSADALTPAERRIADQAAQGMTNREIAESSFLSLRTVETHLTHAYQKLGITSRAELKAAIGS